MPKDLPADPADLGALEARRLIARRQLSASDLAEACIARVDAVDHAVNALVARDFEGLRRDAEAADAAQARGEPLGALHGLPFAVKDMIDVRGLPTTFGSEIFRDNMATRDDRIVAAMRAAGIPNDVHIYDDTQHGFWLYVDRDPATNLEPAADAWARLKAYLRRVLGD